MSQKTTPWKPRTEAAQEAESPHTESPHGTGWLVLALNLGEKAICTSEAGEQIEVVLFQANNYRARIGFRAPQSVKILREELMDAQQDAGDGAG